MKECVWISCKRMGCVFTCVFVLLGGTVNLTLRLWTSEYKLIRFTFCLAVACNSPSKTSTQAEGWKLPAPHLVHLKVNRVLFSLLYMKEERWRDFQGKNELFRLHILASLARSKDACWAETSFVAQVLACVWIHWSKCCRYCLASD